jgi:hypothetical protein
MDQGKHVHMLLKINDRPEANIIKRENERSRSIARMIRRGIVNCS